MVTNTLQLGYPGIEAMRPGMPTSVIGLWTVSQTLTCLSLNSASSRFLLLRVLTQTCGLAIISVTTEHLAIAIWRSVHARAYARGVGLKPPLELDILQNLYYLRKGN